MSKELVCFFSGSIGGKMVDKIIDVCTHRLLSCHGPYFGIAKRWCMLSHTHADAKNREIMLDSGAFSAWSKGGEAHLEDVIRAYDELVERYAPFYKDIWLINLDKIPGKRGTTATQAEIDEAIVISDKNFEILTKRFGPRVLPVFHQDETPRRLRAVIEQNPKYVCISPRNDVHESQRVAWSQRVHEHCGDVWTHGLAATGIDMLVTVPWRSVDSASWTQLAGYGIVVMYIGKQRFMMHVSEDSSFRRMHGHHFDSYPREDQDIIRSSLRDIGLDIEDVRKSYDVRAFVNLYYYNDFVQRNNRYAGSPVQQTLFSL